MNAEIVNTGSELLLGRVLNTHQQWLCERLTHLGIIVTRQTTVADTPHEIRNAISEASGRTPLVIVTGGLGPTSDDLTRQVLGEWAGKRLILHQESLQALQAFYAERKRDIPQSTMVQAYVPEGAKVLPNRFGTAPGLILELGQPPCSVILLPGPPRELYPMFNESVLPYLKQLEGLTNRPTFYLRLTGIGESQAEERLVSCLEPLVKEGLEIGYCARVGELEIRLAAPKEDLVARARDLAQGALSKWVFGSGDDHLEQKLVERLTALNKTVVIAESCTGGFIAHKLTNVPGASAVLQAGLVTYSNRSKAQLLGVKHDTLKLYGAVSAETAAEMAEGARKLFETDFALSVTGIAGPSGGSPEKPVGTVFLGLARKGAQTITEHHLNRLDRESFKQLTSQQALDLLRCHLP